IRIFGRWESNPGFPPQFYQIFTESGCAPCTTSELPSLLCSGEVGVLNDDRGGGRFSVSAGNKNNQGMRVCVFPRRYSSGDMI
ncbi:hypothetical protein B0H17DRAFT_1095311, partial [Mycena rosella]